MIRNVFPYPKSNTLSAEAARMMCLLFDIIDGSHWSIWGTVPLYPWETLMFGPPTAVFGCEKASRFLLHPSSGAQVAIVHTPPDNL